MFPLLPGEKRVSPKLGFFQEHDKLLFSKNYLINKPKNSLNN